MVGWPDRSGDWLVTGKNSDYAKAAWIPETNIYAHISGGGCCHGKTNIWASLGGQLLGAATTLGVFALMNKGGGAGVGGSTSLWGGTGLTGFTGGGSIWSGGGGSGLYGGYNIDNTYLKPWTPVPLSPTVTPGGDGGTVTPDNNGGTVTPQGNNDGGNNGNVQGNDGGNNGGNNGVQGNNGGNDGGGNNGGVQGNNGGNNGGNNSGGGTGTMPAADAFNNAIDDILNGNDHIYQGIHTNSTMNTQDTISAKEKNGIRRGVSEAAQKANPNIKDDTKVDEGYYQYITLTDGTSKNQYTYRFHSSSGNELKYELVPEFTDTDKDGAGTGWEKTCQKPIVTITIEDGKINLTSSGSDIAARQGR